MAYKSVRDGCMAVHKLPKHQLKCVKNIEEYLEYVGK